MKNIEYIKGGIELIETIKPLWSELNIHHKNSAIIFENKMKSNLFEERHNKFNVESLKVFVEVAIDTDKKSSIAYVISSINHKKVGELDSIYVKNNYRNLDIGEKLMNDAMNWFGVNGTKINRLKVAEGNESVFKFYKKFGFEKRFYVLEEVK